MLSYSKGHALVVFLKWMACFIVISQVVGGLYLAFEAAATLVAGERLSFLAMMAGMSSPWLVVLGNTLAWVVFLLWETKSTRVPWRALVVLRAKPALLFAPVFLIGLGMMILINELDVRFAELLPPPDIFIQMMLELGDMTAAPVGSFLALVVVAPITEEILCRGIFLRGMLNRLPPWTAIVLSAAFFAVMHLNPWQAVSAFVIGLVLGWIYLRTRSLALCMFVHALNNAVALYFMSSLGEGVELFPVNTWWLNVAGAALLAAGAAWLWRATRAGLPADEYARAKPPPLPATPPPLPPAGCG